MEAVGKKLKKIAEALRAGRQPDEVTVRDFIEWFGASRRGFSIVQEIKNELERHNLQTEPDFEFAYIDGWITFELLSKKEKKSEARLSREDPTYQIGRLVAANNAPVSIKPSATLEEAVTKMLINDYSQLPVMESERALRGVISWKSIGSRLSLRRPTANVIDCMEPGIEINIQDSLFSAVQLIDQYDYVLVRDAKNVISGIVTAADFSRQFKSMAEPFMLVGEIENGLRLMLDEKFLVSELKQFKHPAATHRKVNGACNLTFGEYQRLLENRDNWAKLELAIDRAEFIRKLNKIRKIRNDVMHFAPDGLDDSSIAVLRDFAQFLKRLRDMGAI